MIITLKPYNMLQNIPEKILNILKNIPFYQFQNNQKYPFIVPLRIYNYLKVWK